jgi:mRNA interferase MazF
VAAPAAGAIVLVRFPFSDLSQAKLRPAVVLADAGRGDQILCQITSKDYGDPTAIQIQQTAFASGSLHVISYVRPAKLFTANRDLIIRTVATLKPEAFRIIVDAVVKLIRGAR